MIALADLASCECRLFLHGTGVSSGDAVVSDAVVRWCVDYNAADPPHVLVHTLTSLYQLAAAEDACTAVYAPLWLPLVRSVRLTSAILAAVRAREADVWAAVAAHLSPEEQLAEWPFVRDQMRALSVSDVRPPSLAESLLDANGGGASGPPPSATAASRARATSLKRGGGGGSSAADRYADRERQQRARYGRSLSGGSGDGSVSSRYGAVGHAGDGGGGDGALTSCLYPGEAVEVQHTRCRTPRYVAPPSTPPRATPSTSPRATPSTSPRATSLNTTPCYPPPYHPVL